MIIDGHAHTGGEYSSLQSIVKTLDKAGAEKVLLSPSDSQKTESYRIPDLAGKFKTMKLNLWVNRLIRVASNNPEFHENIEKGNSEVYDLAALSGGRIVQSYWCNPLREGIADELEKRYEAWKFKGIKLHQCTHPFKIKSKNFHCMAEFAMRKNLPVFIHLYSEKDVLDFISVASLYNLRFIVGHLICLEIFVDLKEKVSRNIFFDVSCPPLISVNRIRLAVREFGPERVIMGSDTPFGENNLQRSIDSVRSLTLRDNQLEMILGNNLESILPI